MSARAAAVSLGLAAAVAIGSSSPALAPPAQLPRAATPARSADAVAPADAVAQPAYERKGRRDPFQPIETSEDLPPAVASARLKGIVRGSATRVLLETADGMGYIMTRGDTLADGRLIEIGTDSVVFSVPARKGFTTGRVILRLPSD